MKIDWLYQMNFGSRCGPCCRVKPVILEQLVTTIVSLWKRFFGACGQGRLGVTCPRGFGNWNSVFKRFRRWANAGVFESLFNAINGEPELEYAMIDGTIVQVHQKASGAKGGLNIKPSGALAEG